MLSKLKQLTMLREKLQAARTRFEAYQERTLAKITMLKSVSELPSSVEEAVEQADARSWKAWLLRKKGYSFARIGQELGVSPSQSDSIVARYERKAWVGRVNHPNTQHPRVLAFREKYPPDFDDAK